MWNNFSLISLIYLYNSQEEYYIKLYYTNYIILYKICCTRANSFGISGIRYLSSTSIRSTIAREKYKVHTAVSIASTSSSKQYVSSTAVGGAGPFRRVVWSLPDTSTRKIRRSGSACKKKEKEEKNLPAVPQKFPSAPKRKHSSWETPIYSPSREQR